jgi:hypothetical protein
LDLDFIGDLLDLLDLLSEPGGGAIGGGLYRWYMERKTRRWPVTAIMIVNRARKDYVVTLGYCYRVEGEVYGGYYARKFLNVVEAQRYLDHFDESLPMYARYDRRRPERSWISM